MPMCDVVELLEYWADHPPAHIVLGAVHLQQKPKQQTGNREELMAAIAQLGGNVRTKAKP